MIQMVKNEIFLKKIKISKEVIFFADFSNRRGKRNCNEHMDFNAIIWNIRRDATSYPDLQKVRDTEQHSPIYVLSVLIL